MDKKEIAKRIDHTILKAEASKEELIKLCNEAKEYGFASVCINPSRVKDAVLLLKDSNVPICTVIGFPLGATSTESKVFESEQAIKDGATELDMVINNGWMKDKNYQAVEADIRAIVNVLNNEIILKVIVETALLNDEEKRIIAEIVRDSGAHYIKTSTGMNAGGGATIEDIKLFRTIVGDKIKIKAAGGIRTYEDAVKMIEAGADRIGASASVKIIS